MGDEQVMEPEERPQRGWVVLLVARARVFWLLYLRPLLTLGYWRARREARRLARLPVREMEVLWWPEYLTEELGLPEPEMRRLLAKTYPGSVTGLYRGHVPEGLMTREGRARNRMERADREQGGVAPDLPKPTPEQEAKVSAGTHVWVRRHALTDDGNPVEWVLLPYDFGRVPPVLEGAVPVGVPESIHDVGVDHTLVIAETAVAVIPMRGRRKRPLRDGRSDDLPEEV